MQEQVFTGRLTLVVHIQVSKAGFEPKQFVYLAVVATNCLDMKLELRPCTFTLSRLCNV